MSLVLITGASRGIGRATAAHLERHGFEVYAAMRDVADAAPLAQLAEAEGLALHSVTLDVTDDASVRSTVEHVLERSGQVDALVNNAAIIRLTPIEHTSPADLAGVLDTNLIGALRTAQAVLPTMRARGSGTIVNISSVAGRAAPFCFGPYVMAKWALEAASEMLAQEVAALGIRVALIEPGFHDTRMLDDATREIGIDPDSAYAERRTPHRSPIRGQQADCGRSATGRRDGARGDHHPGTPVPLPRRRRRRRPPRRAGPDGRRGLGRVGPADDRRGVLRRVRRPLPGAGPGLNAPRSRGFGTRANKEL